ncbi:MAG: right-handed parallel beta-helix repeat-containing protein [Deltaproteobacteria bacterium]|nr:right-handed parallel beta-helix repeat-containing protein [Deltaproteobacteria bacterium]
MVALLVLVACHAAVDQPVANDPGGDTAQDTTGERDCPGEVIVSRAPADQASPEAEGSIAALLAAVPEGCDVRVVLDETGAYTVATDLLLPAWTTLVPAPGAWLQIEAAAALAIDGAIDAGPWQIFDGDGAPRGNPSIDAALAEWFGAVADDGADDALALGRAFAFFHAVTLQSGTYDLAATVVLPSGARLGGPPSTPPEAPEARLRGPLVYPESGGFHPTRLLESASGAAGIELADLVLDGDRHARATDCWSYPEADNLARFEGVSALALDRVWLTGYESNWGTDDQTLTHVIAVLGSADISLVDVHFDDSRVEGILVQDSTGLTVERLVTDNVDVWTPFHAFYVDGFSMTDSMIVEDSGIEWTGSTANLSVRQAVVSGNSFTGGWGLDFGDEVGTEPWGPEDVTIENNRIETVGAGIYFTPYVEGSVAQGVLIHHNELLLHRGGDASAADMVIRLDAVVDVVIDSNTITVPEEGDSFVRGVSLQGSTDGVSVTGNVMSGVDLGVSFSGDVAQGGEVDISGNQITCVPEVRIDTWSGGSTGVWVFRYVAAEFDRVTVEDNDIDCTGGWVSLIDYATLYGAPAPFVDVLEVRDNRFLPESGTERNVFAEAAETTTITGNTPDWVNH